MISFFLSTNLSYQNSLQTLSTNFFFLGHSVRTKLTCSFNLSNAIDMRCVSSFNRSQVVQPSNQYYNVLLSEMSLSSLSSSVTGLLSACTSTNANTCPYYARNVSDIDVLSSSMHKKNLALRVSKSSISTVIATVSSGEFN